MPYPFLGTSMRWYTQYLDADGKTLQAEPGGVYDMSPAQGVTGMEVPPADGLWGAWQDPPEDKPAAKAKPAAEGRAPKNAATAAKGE